jgi:hypothetical protein
LPVRIDHHVGKPKMAPVDFIVELTTLSDTNFRFGHGTSPAFETISGMAISSRQACWGRLVSGDGFVWPGPLQYCLLGGFRDDLGQGFACTQHTGFPLL